MTADGMKRYEVGVEGRGREYEHITVEASSPEEAYRKAVKEARSSIRYDLEKPLHAYQAYEIGEGVTHTP